MIKDLSAFFISDPGLHAKGEFLATFAERQRASPNSSFFQSHPKYVGFEVFLTQTIKEYFSGHQSSQSRVFTMEKGQAFDTAVMKMGESVPGESLVLLHNKDPLFYSTGDLRNIPSSKFVYLEAVRCLSMTDGSKATCQGIWLAQDQ